VRIVEVVADAGHMDTVTAIAEQYGATDVWWGAEMEDGRRTLRLLVPRDKAQSVIDALQNLLATAEGARIVILPVEAVLPRPRKEDGDDEQAARRSAAATREELYHQVEKGARLDSNFLLLVVLSTIVAAIGLSEDNVAVVVGAMVIAPLLGPNIALAFGAALGDRELIGQALKTNLTGLGLALVTALLIGLAWAVNLDSHELQARTDVGLDGVALAMASGAAAVLSLAMGVSTALVGVMVAVALLPPTAALGMLLGAGQPALAAGAGLLLAVNIVCVILSAMLVFLVKGVKPRTWLEKRKARQSFALSIVVWVTLLAVLLAAIWLRSGLGA